MIFSKFFKAKWQHKDATVRVLAVNEELELNNKEHLAVLNNLLATDNSDLVRRAVLIKLNSFDVWLQESKSNTEAKIREYASKQLKKIFSDEHALKLTADEKIAQLPQLDKAYLEAWLINEIDAKVIIALIETINKPHMLPALFTKKNIVEVQQYIIDKTTDLATLERFAKKAKATEVQQLLKEKIAAIKVKAELPVKTKKTTQLILSKLLSLKDVSNYEVMLERKTNYLKEWQEISESFDCLTNDDKTEFLEKYQTILTQLEKVFVAKAEAHEQEKILKALSDERVAAKDKFEQQISSLSQQLATSIFTNETIDEEASLAKLDLLQEQVSASVLEGQIKKVFLTRLKEQRLKLTQVPIIAQSVAEATQLISKISQLATPSSLEDLTDKLPIYDQWQSDWKKITKQAVDFIPASLIEAHDEICTKWKLALKPLFSEQRQTFGQAKKKVEDLKRLIASGKYNAAFGLFKRVEKQFLQLDNSQQQRLQRDYDALKEKMTELADWEHYIATPRKQQLLEEIQQLVDRPLDNPAEQAAKVKEFRGIWNTLGHADDNVDKELNASFNQACENAFAPCRQYYAEQEKLRMAHLESRLLIIENAGTLANDYASEPVNWKDVDGRLNKLQQQWKDAGDVDRNQYKKLQQKFSAVTKPVKAAIATFHETNAAEKRVLINKVKEALASDDIFSAINTVKNYQTKWKSIGYSGPKEENKLWIAFRQANDQVFAKRDNAYAEEKQKQSSIKDDFNQKIEHLKAQFSVDMQADKMNDLQDEIEEFKQQVFQTKPVFKAVLTNIEQLLEQITNVKSTKKLQAVRQQWQTLFSLLEKVAANDIEDLAGSEEFNKLPSFWKKKVSQAAKNEVVNDRGNKTIELEILAGTESPSELSKERMAVQVDLLQNQMLSGGKVDLDASLSDWLVIGALTNNDIPLINRLKPIFCQ